jgi:hypothetical protein
MTDAGNQKLMGFVALACAVVIACAAFLDRKVIGLQRWEMLMAASVFGLVGWQLVFAVTGRLSHMLAGFACVGFSALGLFAVFTRDKLGGGIPFLPESWNQAFGRGLFGFGALVTGALAFYFFRRALRRE